MARLRWLAVVVVALAVGALVSVASVEAAQALLRLPQANGTGLWVGTTTITANQHLAVDSTGTKIVGAAAGSGAPSTATYVTMTLDGTLSAERTLAGESSVVSIGDGGANGAVTVGISADGITDAKLRNSGALSVIGRSANSSGDPADISASAASGAVLRESGSTLGFGTVATAGIANDAVTFAKFQHIGSDRLLGRDDPLTGTIDEIRLMGGLEFDGSEGLLRSALTGDVTASAGSNSTTIANDAVTYAKIQNVSATDKVLGRSTSGAGDVEEIACTAAGRALLDDADAAAQRTTLGGVWATVVKSSDQSGIGTSATDVTGLSVAVLNGQTIRFRAYIRHEQDSAGIASMFSVNGPSATFATFNIQEIVTATGAAHNALDSFNARTVQGTGGFIGEVFGVAKFSADGTFIVRAKSETGGTITVREGSWLEYRIE